MLKEKWLYNLGGAGSEWSFGRMQLPTARAKQWEEVVIKDGSSFDWWQGYGIHTMRGTIAFFGSRIEQATFILKEVK